MGGEMQTGYMLKLYKGHKKAKLELYDVHKVRKVRQILLTKYEKFDIISS